VVDSVTVGFSRSAGNTLKMNDQNKEVGRTSPRRIGWFRAWLILTGGVFISFLIIAQFIPPLPRTLGDWLKMLFAFLVGSAVIATVLVGIAVFFRWVFRRQNFKRFIFGCICLATLIALFYAEEDWRGKYDWENFKQQWEAKGENFDNDSVVPQPVPDDENFAMSPVWVAELKRNFLTEPKRAEDWYGDRIYSEEVSNYFRLLPVSDAAVIGTNESWNLPSTPDTLGFWAVGRVSDLRPWQSFYRNLEHTHPSLDIAITPKPQTPAQDVLLALSKYDPLIERLRQDSQLPYSRFPIEYNVKDKNPAAILLPHLSAIKGCAQVLKLRAIAELQNGQSDKALADVELMFRLADADRVEPFLICHLVRFAVLQIAIQPIYEGLADHQWSDSQLAELDSKLSDFDLLNDYKFSLRGEMIFLEEGVLDYLRRHPAQMGDLPSGTGASPPALNYVIPSGWYYQNELHSVRAMERYYLPAVDTNQDILSPSAIRAADSAIKGETRHVNPYDLLERMTLPVLTGPSITVAYAQTAVNLARVAIALERYRLAHGQYPDSLDTLTPQFVTRLPHDIIDGHQLHYQRTTDGQFILYSVGWNETDDGGVVIFKRGSTGDVDREQGDWVWRYPAAKSP
jgi:hypothetical protein